MADFETEFTVKLPYKDNKDSDLGSYYHSNHARDSLFNTQDESADTSGDDWE